MKMTLLGDSKCHFYNKAALFRYSRLLLSRVILKNIVRKQMLFSRNIQQIVKYVGLDIGGLLTTDNHSYM